MTKELKVVEIPASGNPNWMGGAFCIVFVYSKYNGNFIVKGFRDEVDSYLTDKHTHYFANYTLWSGNEHRSIWKFWNHSCYIIEPDRCRRYSRQSNVPNYKWRITNFKTGADKIKFEFRRIPKRWIPEFNNLK